MDNQKKEIKTMRKNERGNKNKNYESNYIEELRSYFNSLGCYTYKINERFSSGFPDLLVVNNGITIYVEAKVDNNAPTAMQQYVMESLAKRAAIVLLMTRNLNFDKDGKIWNEKIIRICEDGSAEDFPKSCIENILK